jgi:hypothetical protein
MKRAKSDFIEMLQVGYASAPELLGTSGDLFKLRVGALL